MMYIYRCIFKQNTVSDLLCHDCFMITIHLFVYHIFFNCLKINIVFVWIFILFISGRPVLCGVLLCSVGCV